LKFADAALVGPSYTAKVLQLRSAPFGKTILGDTYEYVSPNAKSASRIMLGERKRIRLDVSIVTIEHIFLSLSWRALKGEGLQRQSYTMFYIGAFAQS
jgi:hypothetical protein